MGGLEDTIEERENWHWRNTMRPVRFFMLDARAVLPYYPLLFYPRPITLFITILITITFLFLEKRGLTFPAAVRSIRLWFVGQSRPAWISYRKRKMVDYG